MSTKCAALVHTVLGRQNVPCESIHFVVPHWILVFGIHSDIYLVNKEAIHYILIVCI